LGLPILSPPLDRIDWVFMLDLHDVDRVLQAHDINEVYTKVDTKSQSRPTVPEIVDAQMQTVVQNDHHQLTFCFEKEWRYLHKPGVIDLLPVEMEVDIEAMNGRILEDIHSLIYQCGFAKS
jgi:putative glutathione S-transferase